MANSKTKRVGKYSEPMKRICVALEARMFAQCKKEALDLGMDMSAYLRMLIVKQRKQGAGNGSKEKNS